MASPSMRRSVAPAAAVAVAVIVGMTSTVHANGAVPVAPGTYVKAVPVCSPFTKAGQPPSATCFAMKLVSVPAGTSDARPAQSSVAFATGPAGGYTPSLVASAYGVNPDAATSMTVGIVDAFDDPNALADLNAFNAQYGLAPETATSFKKVNQNGATIPLPPASTSWAAEISVDLDAVRGLCHKCKIILVEALSNAQSDLDAATNQAVALGARIVSNSYGFPETGPISPADVAAYNHPNVVILAASGNDGMYNWDRLNSGGISAGAPNIPASLNSVVAVGGTTLYLNPNGTRASETVWNENGFDDHTGYLLQAALGATGGGCSTQVNARGWQANATGYGQTGCSTHRLAADIAALADPYLGYDVYDTYNSFGWQTYGGTSLATPLVAAMWALAGGPAGAPYPSIWLYGHYKSDASHPLYDVVAGGNGLCAAATREGCFNTWGASPNSLSYGTVDCYWQGSPPYASTGLNTRECVAAPGYDGPSGVGTPNGINAFKPIYETVVITKPATITHGSAAQFGGSTTTDPFPGGYITTYSWNFGDGSAASTVANPMHTFASAGTFTVTLTVGDIYSIHKAGSVQVTVN